LPEDVSDSRFSDTAGANAFNTWETNLIKDIKMKVSKNTDGVISEDGPGQFLTDLGKLYRDLSSGAPSAYRQRVYTPEVLGLNRKPSVEEIEAMEKQMNDKVVDMIDDPKYEEYLMDTLDIDKTKVYAGDSAEELKLNEAISNLKKMVQGTYEKSPGLRMMKIYPFDTFVP
jgi:hypothetical protein